MPIPLPNLDDRSFADLTAEAQALIPSLCPTWTNHNPSDPGIVIIELMAWLTETVLYQLNEIPDQNVESFLGLLGESRIGEEPLDKAVRRTILQLRDQYRAVTAADFETLALRKWPDSPEAQALSDANQQVALRRAHAVPHRNLSLADEPGQLAAAPGHVSLIVMPETTQPFPQPSQELVEALWRFLDSRRLLTTRHHVVGPTYLPVQVELKIQLDADALVDEVLARVYRALSDFFDPLSGGPMKTGWPFGRDIHVSEIHAELETIPRIDFIDEVILAVPGRPGRVQTEGETIVGVTLQDHELVELQVNQVVAYTDDGAAHEQAVVGMIEQWRLG